jgi:DNA-binding transcriptional MerR regulator
MSEISIGKLACAASISADTIRFYERQGLLSRAPRGKSGYRRYTVRHLRELIVIRQARSVGFTLEDIAELLALRSTDEPAHVARVIDARLATINRAIETFGRWRAALIHLRETGIQEGEPGWPAVPEQLLRESLLDISEPNPHSEDMIHEI